MSEWQPIETAPKDGSYMILYFPGGFWKNDCNIAIGFWGTDDDWYECESDGNSMTQFGDKPTHWMPLPNPPTEAGLRVQEE